MRESERAITNLLLADAIVKDNGQILNYMEGMEALDGIKDVVWSEVVKAVGKKNSVPGHIVDLL